MFPEHLLLRTLDTLERRELASLQWGYVDGTLRDAEVDAVADRVLREAGVAGPGEQVIDALVSRRLLIRWRRDDGTYRFRSRFAEGVRLLSRLKQLFDNKPWLTAPDLVSGFRVDARPRQIPRRDQSPKGVLQRLRPLLGDPAQESLLGAMLGVPGTPMDLAAFQVRTAERILAHPTETHGTIVTAGTGSGKTLAFYLPAYLELGAWIDRTTWWTKALAVYPRRELLKDQFTEAYRLARRLDAPLKAAGRRPIVIGTFFGLTPNNASESDEQMQQRGWRISPAGAVCPFLRCPNCEGDLLWLSPDRQQQAERLVCSRAPQCSGNVSAEHVVLTRDRAGATPPDVVFTTTETLNQRLSDTKLRHVFGIRPERERRCRLVLLDEVHTYEGTSGAHAALVLRRWRNAVRAHLRMVGLSATLAEAPDFFSQLTGIPRRLVDEVTPVDAEMVHRSMAYQLLLRGDPVSQTSLLSTSIQSSFLLQRLLDPPNGGATSGGTAGSRTFVFTDDLDVANRLFDNLRDAEGYDAFGRRVANKKPLAHLRANSEPDGRLRDRAGQLWRASEEIGWPLDQPLRITRTTSQDAGVSQGSDIVVATAALEVGFNDPQVGAVVQHKSPRQMAAFVQRKGRAGRTVDMRPWMVTVLSDYGRDRVTYQAYEQLFDPLLPVQRLPIGNQYILRMQAVFAFIDWLAENNASKHMRGWWWVPLNGPARYDWTRNQQAGVQTTLRALLRGDQQVLEQLQEHLRRALGVDAETVQSILWEPPRPLLLEVLPTLARRLYTDWQAVPRPSTTEPSTDLKAASGIHPLPDFLPANLFSDLSLPEVTIALPPATRNAPPRFDTLPVVPALRQLAPGRVTRRFAWEKGGLSHWVPVPLDRNDYPLPIDQFATEYEYVVDVPVLEAGQVVRVPCYRPWTIAAQQVPEQRVNATSNAVLHWASELVPPEGGVSFAVERTQGWQPQVQEVTFFVHASRAPITVRRYASGATATVRVKGREDDHVVETRFVAGVSGGTATVGVEHEVDGLCLRLQLPGPDALVQRATGAKDAPAWRAAYVRDRVLHDHLMASEANWFERDWLYQVYVSSLLALAAEDETRSLPEAAKLLAGADAAQRFTTAMEAIFRIGPDEDMSDESGPMPPNEGASVRMPRGPARLRDRLADLLSRTSVLDRLGAIVSEIWAPDAAAFGQWLQARLHESLGEAVLMACLEVAPRHAAIDTLILDLQRGLGPTIDPTGAAEIWVTETTLGGAGVVESIARSYAADPRSFFKAIEAAIAPNDLETTATTLDLFADKAVNEAAVRDALAALRRERDHTAREQRRVELYRLLAEHGLSVDHTFSVALHHRFLREGQDAAWDAEVLRMLRAWRAYEERFGIAVDLRLFSYLATCTPAFRAAVERIVRAATGARPAPADLLPALSGVLWARDSEMRARFFDGYSPFRDRGHVDPSLVRHLLFAHRERQVALDDADMHQRVKEALAEWGSVQMVAPRSQEQQLQVGILHLIATPVDMDFLQFFPAVESVRRDHENVWATLILRELG